MLYLLDRLIERRARRDVMRVRVELHFLEGVGLVAGQRIELGDFLDLVAEEGDAPGAVLVMRGEDLDRIAAHAEGAAAKGLIVALVLKGDEIGDELLAVEPLAELHAEGHGRIGFDRADTVDAGNRGDDDDVVALQQRACGGVAHAVDLLVDRAFLLDIGVGPGHIGLRLVVVVIGNEILDRIFREEALELAIELGGERLVGREDEGRALGALDHLRHCVGLAGARDAEQHLIAVAFFDALDEFGDGGGLVARRLIFGDELERAAAFGFLGPFGTMGRKKRPVGGVAGKRARPCVAIGREAAFRHEIRAGCFRQTGRFPGQRPFRAAPKAFGAVIVCHMNNMARLRRGSKGRTGAADSFVPDPERVRYWTGRARLAQGVSAAAGGASFQPSEGFSEAV